MEVLLLAPEAPALDVAQAPQAAQVLWPGDDRTPSPLIPEQLRRELLEARDCVRARAYSSAVVMIRRLLEGVCRDHGVTAHPLFKGLHELRRKGLIDGRLPAWAEQLRVIGNEAAHIGGGPIDQSDAEDAVGLAEALLDHLYVVTPRYEAFVKRRGGPLGSSGRAEEAPDTPAVRALRRAGAAFTPHAFDHDPARPKSRRAIADTLGIPHGRMLKAVVAYVDGHVVIAVLPVSAGVELTALAKAVDGRAARVAEPAELSGPGVVSPLGLPLRLPTVLDPAALAAETVYVSSGRPGLELELTGADLIRVTGAVTAPITAPGGPPPP